MSHESAKPNLKARQIPIWKYLKDLYESTAESESVLLPYKNMFRTTVFKFRARNTVSVSFPIPGKT
jgi:hypothetical protein